MADVAGFTRIDGNPHGKIPTVVAFTLHRTYSPTFGSAYNAILNNGTAQWLVGQTEDEGAFQFMDSGDLAYHCNGSNFRGPGVELHGTNDDELTDFQVGKLHDLLVFLRDTYKVDIGNYADPAKTPHASIWVNGGMFHGVISHDSVRTDDGTSQHTDAVSLADYERALEGDDMNTDQVDAEIDRWLNESTPFGTRFEVLMKKHPEVFDAAIDKWLNEKTPLGVRFEILLKKYGAKP